MIRLEQAVSPWNLPGPAEDARAPHGGLGGGPERRPAREAREWVEVLIVDDDALVRGLLTEILGREERLRVVGDAGDPIAALELARRHAPQVIVLDADLPRSQSAELIDRIAELELASKVLLLTQDADEESVLQALRRGAHGYLPKQAAVAMIGRAVRALAAGEAWIERRMTGRLLEELARLARQAEAPRGQGSTLSLRERQIVQLIAAGKTNHEIAQALFLSPHTVKSHVSHILQKLSVPNRTEVAIFAVKAGWVSRAA